MAWLTRLRYSLRALVRRETTEQELDDELRFHLEMQIKANVAAGMTPEQARYAALRSFGGVDKAKEECRDARGLAFLESLWQDLRFAKRLLMKRPGFTSVAVLTLAVGIGINTAMFSIVDALLLRELPYPNADRLVSIFAQAPGLTREKTGLSTAEFFRIRETSQSLAQVEGHFGTFQVTYLSFRDAEVPRQLRYATLTRGYFSLLGYHPLHGTLPSEAARNEALPVILNHDLWQSQFGGNPNIVNTVHDMTGGLRPVAAIMPPGFRLPDDLASDERFEIYMPFDTQPSWVSRNFTVVGALKAGKQVSELQAELDLLTDRLRQERPASYGIQADLRAVPLREHLVGDVRVPLLLLAGAVGLVLLIACANVANLLLARGAVRRRELALRAAVGASRRRLASQLFAESLIIGVFAATVGLLLAYSCLKLVVALAPVQALPPVGEIGLNTSVLGFTALVAFAAAVLFGLLPALHVSRFNLNEALRVEARSASGGRSRQRLRSTLVVAEVSLAFILVICAGLLLRSFGKLLQVNLGFDPHDVITARVQLRRASYENNEKVMAFHDAVREKLLSQPGVTAVGGLYWVPLSRRPIQNRNFEIEGRAPAAGDNASNAAPSTNLNIVAPGYFETMNVPLLRGRFLTNTDRPGQPLVTVVNETMARRFFPGEDVLGKRIKFDIGKEWMEIVGVVADSKNTSLDEVPTPEIYIFAAQAEQSGFFVGPVLQMSLLVKATSGISADQFRSAVREIDPAASVFDVEPVEQYVSRALARPRFILTLLGGFAAVAFLLASIGVYGLISYSVTQRTREIGIRLALGASQGDVFKLIVGQGLILALAGVGVGLAASLALTQLMAGLLYGVSPTDPLTYLTVAFLLVAVAVLASFVPARRAARVDPMQALRAE